VRPHGWPDLDPAVLAKLRKIAAIREEPYAALHVEMCRLHNQRALLATQQGNFVAPIFPPPTAAEQFDLNIKSVVYVTHLSVDPRKLTARKEIARCAQDLANVLRALRRDEKKTLLHFLPRRRQASFDDFITATRELAGEARRICSLAGKPPRAALRRITLSSFVSLLLDAASDAGGGLGLNSRSQRGTLVDAIKLLLPFLPKEISEMPSFSTLKRLRKAWVQNRKK
jgi:hypothetical protein